MVLDPLGRPLTDLRISVTDACSLRCPYCLPLEAFPLEHPFLGAGRLLSFAQILRFVEAARPLGLTKVKITGGEPLLRPLVPELVRDLKTRWPDLEVGLITNGLALGPLVGRLRDAGLDGVTVSLDALDPGVYARMSGTGRRVEPVLEAIEAAHRAFGAVKLNTVLLRGQNDGEVEALALRYRRPGFTLRFIEFMPVGQLNGWDRSQVVPGDEVRGRLAALGGTLEALEPGRPGQTSRVWAWAGGQGAVGFIDSVTRPFCGSCTRLRLTADGRALTCLFSEVGPDFGPALRKAQAVGVLTERLAGLWAGRVDRWSEGLRAAEGEGGGLPAGPRPEMHAVGG